MNEKLRTQRLLIDNPKWVEIIKEAFEVEKRDIQKYSKQYPDYKWLGFEWHQVHARATTLNKMVANKILDVSYNSHSATNYVVTNPSLTGEIITTLESAEEEFNESDVPDNAFESITGYDDIKEYLLKALRGEKRIHILFESPPAVGAKSTFMMCIETIMGGSCYFATGSKVKPGGLTEVLMSSPRVLLLDEVDKLDSQNYATLLSGMESGNVMEAKYKRHTRVKINTMVVGACNSTKRIPSELLSRFDFHLKLKPYDKNGFIEVCKNFLSQFESISRELAEYIATRVWDSDKIPSDPRKARGIARMIDKTDMKSGKVEVNKLIEFEEKYK